jgi:drug/metabolite transporter (DMT)-like permease
LNATACALGAIALWAMLAALSLLLKHVPPFLLTGLALLIGSAITWPQVFKNAKLWRVSSPVFLLGVGTLFGFHFLLFVALRMAPAVEVNLVNYLWPLLMVILSPLYLPGERLRAVHVLAAVLGFAGAALAILGARTEPAAAARANASAALAYACAGASAFLWANYSLQTKRLAQAGRAFAAPAIGLFGLVSGILSLLCHVLLEPAVQLSARDGLLVALMGFGPLGGAFLLWDNALKRGNARQIGTLSYLTPLGSTLLLLMVTGRALSWQIGLAALLIVGAALLATRSR